MKSNMFKILALILALVTCVSLAACGGGDTETAVADDIVNGDFEDVSSGQWVGWTRKDAAFNFRGVTNLEKVNNVQMEKSGNYYFSGTVGGNPPMRGTLTSDPFKLGGNGFITFKMGGGKNTEKCYVEFFVEGTEAAVAKITNPECDGTFITDHLITKVVDLSAYVGKTITIVVTDNDDGSDCSWLNLDAFKVCKTQEEVDAAKADHDRQVEEFGEKPFEENPADTTIKNGGFETGDLTGWMILEGKALTRAAIVPTSQYYWSDRMVYGEGEYYLDGSNNGAIQESLTGAIRSTKFTLAGDGYITFMLGSGNGGSYLALCDAETDEELIKQENTYFSDPTLALTLLRYYIDASQYIGKVCYIKIVDANDGSNGGFAFINADDIRVSMTRAEVAALQVEQLEKANSATYTSASYNDLASLRSYYAGYPYLVALESLTMKTYASNTQVDCGTVDLTTLIKDAKATFGEETIDCSIIKVTFNDTEYKSGFESFDMSEAGNYIVTYGASRDGKTVEASITVIAIADRKSIPNGGFETGDLSGWTILTEGWGVVEGQYTGVISAPTYWGEELPYNQAGNYHLDGWNTGIAEPDTWQIRSGNFVLSGSGFISVRMGGHAAAVHVYMADGQEIGYYKQTRFNDANFPHVGQGGSWADMGTYVIDLSRYIGQELYIILADEDVAGWSHAFFDEIVTYYETAPDYANLADTVMDGHTGDETPSEITIPWQLAGNEIANPPEPPVIDPNAKRFVNGGFETGDLTGWTVLTEGWGVVEGQPTGVISAPTYWGEELPYNQAGNYHLDGWNTGIAEPDTWQIRSGNFVLSGSGFISVRMGGNAAAVHVYKAEGTEIGYYKQTRFNDANFPHVGQGGSWADMGTYVIDLSAYIGKDLYIVLADEEAAGWAHAFFDEIVIHYDTVPDYANLADTVMDGHTGEETPVEITIPWRLAENLI